MSILTTNNHERPSHSAQFTLSAANQRRKALEADVNAYLSKGGKITTIPGFERTLENPDYTALRRLPAAMGVRA